jgi:uncharacterized OsmC-like protein
MTVAYTSFIQIKKHGGAHRTAVLKDFKDPIHFGIHGGIKDFYQQKYGREIKGPEYPATLDYVIAGVAGWLTGTLASALDARGISAEDNLVADVQGDVEDVDGVLKITKIRIRYTLKTPAELKTKAERALSVYADMCPAYQTVKNCLDCTWEADIMTE